jgi:hypothetical protein
MSWAHKLGGVTVCDQTENLRFVETADLAIITGMALANRTQPGLIWNCQEKQHIDDDVVSNWQKILDIIIISSKASTASFRIHCHSLCCQRLRPFGFGVKNFNAFNCSNGRPIRVFGWCASLMRPAKRPPA